MKGRLIVGILGILFIDTLALSGEECIAPGCCLIPPAGCIIGMSLLKEDTTKEGKEWEKLKDLPFWKRLGFGIGYSGGVCWTGEDLERHNPPPLDPTAKLYWLNSIEGITFYKMNSNYAVGIEAGYMWTDLKDREGLDMYIPYAFGKTHADDGLLTTSEYWEIRGFHFGPMLSYGFMYLSLEGIFVKTKTEEYLWISGAAEPPISSAYVTRSCIGLGLSIRISLKETLHTPIYPFFKIRLGASTEYKNDAPWEWEWKKKLTVNLTGFYFGLIFKGGVK